MGKIGDESSVDDRVAKLETQVATLTAALAAAKAATPLKQAGGGSYVSPQELAHKRLWHIDASHL